MSGYIPQMEPWVTQADAAAVDRYLASGGWLTEHTHTRKLEERLCEYTGARHCSMVPSGTLALFLALKACDVGRDDEVIVPDLTMAASATAAVLAGAKVVFADIDPVSLCLDLAGAESLISGSTKAVVFVSLNGRSPAGLGGFVARCQARGVRIVEDAAQSLGSRAEGRHLGTIGDCGCFSFSSQKIVTTGQGGAVVTDDDAIHRKVALLKDFGRLEGGSDHYSTIGWNFKFTDLQAVIGLSQMGRVAGIVDFKKALFRRYRDGLAGVEGIELPATDLDKVTPWFVDALVDPARKAPLMKFLHQNGVGTRALYPALHSEPAFSMPGAFPVAEAVSARGLWLPSSLRLAEQDVDRICGLVSRFLAG